MRAGVAATKEAPRNLKALQSNRGSCYAVTTLRSALDLLRDAVVFASTPGPRIRHEATISRTVPRTVKLGAMSKLVRGDQLPSDLRREVLARYTYRWTSDNTARERAWRGIEGAPTIPLVSDAQWLREHAFYVTDRNTLDKRRTNAEPAYMAKEEGKSTIKSRHATNTRSGSRPASRRHVEMRHHAAKKSPAQLDREIAEVLSGGTNGDGYGVYVRSFDGYEHVWKYMLGPFATKSAAEKHAEDFRGQGKEVAVMPKSEFITTDEKKHFGHFSGSRPISHARKVSFAPGDPKRYPGYALSIGGRGPDVAYFRSKEAAFRAAKRLANEKNQAIHVARITKNQDRQIADEVYPSGR